MAASLELVDHWREVLHELLEELEVGLLIKVPLEVDLLDYAPLESNLLHAFELPNVEWLPQCSLAFLFCLFATLRIPLIFNSSCGFESGHSLACISIC